MEDRAKLTSAVRSWVHMDNLIETLNKQASNARELRTKHESEAIALIHKLGLRASTIQISGATLTVRNQRRGGDLTWGYLEREVPAWCQKSGLPAAKSAELLEWLQTHRDVREVEVIHKSRTSSAKETKPKDK